MMYGLSTYVSTCTCVRSPLSQTVGCGSPGIELQSLPVWLLNLSLLAPTVNKFTPGYSRPCIMQTVSKCKVHPGTFTLKITVNLDTHSDTFYASFWVMVTFLD